jgi:uncharacterized protein (DUF885 family)
VVGKAAQGFAAAVGLLAAAMAAAAAPPPAGPQDGRLKALYEAEFAWRRAEEARTTDFGPAALTDSLPRVDPASQVRRLAYWEKLLVELDGIPLDQLSPEERINAQVFRTSVEIEANQVRWRTYEIPFNTDSFFWTLAPPRGRGFRTADEYRRYIGRIRDIPRFFEENIANMRAGLARGFSNPRITLEGRDRTVEPYLDPSEANPLWGPFAAMPSTIPADEQARLKAEGAAAIRDVAAPAYARLLAMLRTEYWPKARATTGASELPDGRAFYRAMVRDYTTTRLTPAEIHQIGLSEVARIRADMDATMRSTGFEGTLSEFMLFLRTDPQFYARTPAELLGKAAWVVMKANGRLNETVGTLPRFRHGIVPVPAEIAPIYTSGRGGLENCMFNTYRLESRPLYTLPALTLHECTPGHSFQAALALEAPARPDFRRELYFSGYGEGWGLYTEWLGQGMGIYETPYEEFGRQTYEMWRAVRLVIDTGIHEYGWSRDRALAYFRDHVALSELEIVNEVDRYISWPGQALAYKLGELTIRKLRLEAETKLGPRFDQRHFHDVILGLGAVPLTVLEAEVRRWIDATDAAPPAKAAAGR